MHGFHLEDGHVVPALINKFVSARRRKKDIVEVWGDGSAERDFLYIDDLSSAILSICDNFEESGSFNVASGESISIAELVNIIKNEVGYEGKVAWSCEYPQGQTRRIFNFDKIKATEWKARFPLKKGIEKTIQWYLENK